MHFDLQSRAQKGAVSWGCFTARIRRCSHIYGMNAEEACTECEQACVIAAGIILIDVAFITW